MDNATKQEFTRRITQSNRGQMIVVMYDICFSYLQEAREVCADGQMKEYKDAVKNADRVIARLQDTLDFKYELAGELYPLYTFCRKELMKSVYQQKTEGIENADKVLHNLYAGFKEAAAQDDSEPLMHNTQQVYAGMTYGKETINENYREPDTSRGFFA